jgi:hypothetical protein
MNLRTGFPGCERELEPTIMQVEQSPFESVT